MMKTPYISHRASTALTGEVRIPGDKSMSHRSLMFGLLAKGRTTVTGLLEGEDVMDTAEAVRKLGGKVEKDKENDIWNVDGIGLDKLQSPSSDLQMGNSGTSTRLLMGLIAGHNITARMIGDASLSKRPMNRVIVPLEQMGAKFESTEGGRLPLNIFGSNALKPISYKLPVASAQVKSAILLAGLNAEGTTTVIETKPTRDHTENMLRHFGAQVDVEDLDDGAQAIHIHGKPVLKPCHIDVYADPSSAAFPAVSALLVPGSKVTLHNVGLNERRSGVFSTLIEMGADIQFINERNNSGEPVADIVITGGKPLKGITVPATRVPSMIDEFPILSMAAACAEGTTYMSGLEELRVKESDRLKMVADGLKACGVDLIEGEDSLTIHGTGTPPKGGAFIETALDHRIAMSFLILGLATQEPVSIDDVAPVATSFPNFITMMADLGANMHPLDQNKGCTDSAGNACCV